MDELTNSIVSATLVFSVVLTAFIYIVIYLLTSLGYMKCMQKANEKGWKAWIPFYRDVVMYKIVGLTPWLVSVSIVKSIISIISVVYVVSTIPAMITEIQDTVLKDVESSYQQSSSYGTNTTYSYKTTTGSYSYNPNQTEINKIVKKYQKQTEPAVAIDLIDTLLGIAVFVIGIFFAIYISKAYGLSGGYIAGMIIVPTIFILIIGFGKSKYVGKYKLGENNK